tara:strand:+ start:643 stop:813 length:171 start_codon:yes stop_codon:yes gene_type:complete
MKPSFAEALARDVLKSYLNFSTANFVTGSSDYSGARVPVLVIYNAWLKLPSVSNGC